MSWQEPTADTLAVNLDDAAIQRPLDALVSTLRWDLSSQETVDARSLWTAENRAPGVADLGQITALETLMGRIEGRWLVDLIGQERLTSHYQPIVYANAPETVFGHEALVRGDDGQGGTISGGRIMDAARRADLLFQLDFAARTSAIERRPCSVSECALLINFSPAAIYDPVYCLRETVKLVEKEGVAPENIIFEVTESEQVLDLDHLKNILNYYRQRGFRVALDDVGAGYASLNMLYELNPDIAKVDMGLIRGVHADPVKATIAAKVLETARALGTVTIAEGIETRGELTWVRENGADFVQGFGIARPSADGAMPEALVMED